MVTHVSCREAGYDCEFLIQSENLDEVIEFTRGHAKQSHDLELTKSDVKELIRE